jgi:hypothetical protein
MVSEEGCRHVHRFPWYLRHGQTGDGLGTPKDRQADHAFVADRRHFDLLAVLHEREQGADHRQRKVDRGKSTIGFVERLFERQRDGFQRGDELLVHLFRQGCQQAVFQRTLLTW